MERILSFNFSWLAKLLPQWGKKWYATFSIQFSIIIAVFGGNKVPDPNVYKV